MEREVAVLAEAGEMAQEWAAAYPLRGDGSSEDRTVAGKVYRAMATALALAAHREKA